MPAPLAANAKAPCHAKAKAEYLLHGKLFCGMCGAPMVGECGRGRHGTTYYYTCAIRKKAHTCEKRNKRKNELATLRIASRGKIRKPDIVAWISQFRARGPADPDYRKKVIELFVNSIYIYDDKIKLFFNARDSAQITYPEMLALDDPPVRISARRACFFSHQGGFIMQDYVQAAKALGFTDAALMEVKDLVIVPEYRMFCEENLCGNYGVLPACPPESGSVKEMTARVQRYKTALVLMIEHTPVCYTDHAEQKAAKKHQNILTEELMDRMREDGMDDLLMMGAGPWKGASCMSAYCVNAQKMAEHVHMKCWDNDGKIRYFSLILF